MQPDSLVYVFEPKTSVPHDRLFTSHPKIDSLNLERIIAKSVHPETKLEWTVQEALQVSDLYRVFLFLCMTYPDDVIVPPREVDEFWHLHILDTRNYEQDCQEIFGRYLHHFPYAGMTEISKASELSAIEHTTALVRRHFPEVLGDS